MRHEPKEVPNLDQGSVQISVQACLKSQWNPDTSDASLRENGAFHMLLSPANSLQGSEEQVIINDSLLNAPTEPTEWSVSNH